MSSHIKYTQSRDREAFKCCAHGAITTCIYINGDRATNQTCITAVQVCRLYIQRTNMYIHVDHKHNVQAHHIPALVTAPHTSYRYCQFKANSPYTLYPAVKCQHNPSHQILIPLLSLILGQSLPNALKAIILSPSVSMRQQYNSPIQHVLQGSPQWTAMHSLNEQAPFK